MKKKERIHTVSEKHTAAPVNPISPKFPFPPPLPITGIAVQIVADDAGIQIVFPFTKLPPTILQLFTSLIPTTDPIDPPSGLPFPVTLGPPGPPIEEQGGPDNDDDVTTPPVDVTVILDELDLLG